MSQHAQSTRGRVRFFSLFWVTWWGRYGALDPSNEQTFVVVETLLKEVSCKCLVFGFIVLVLLPAEGSVFGKEENIFFLFAQMMGSG